MNLKNRPIALMVSFIIVGYAVVILALSLVI